MGLIGGSIGGRLGLAVTAGALFACSLEPTPASTTTVPTTTTTAVPVDGASASASFRECMSTAGFDVGEVPVDENGRPDLAALRAALDEANSESAAGFRETLTSCAPLLGSFLSLAESPGLRAMVRDQLVLYARCMRASGVEDFPDPAPGFDGTTSPFPPEQIPLADPEFNTALESCAAAMTVSP